MRNELYFNKTIFLYASLIFGTGTYNNAYEAKKPRLVVNRFMPRYTYKTSTYKRPVTKFPVTKRTFTNEKLKFLRVKKFF